jgi:hypothetical protein
LKLFHEFTVVYINVMVIKVFLLKRAAHILQ